jgi:hypothetical protein
VDAEQITLESTASQPSVISRLWAFHNTLLLVASLVLLYVALRTETATVLIGLAAGFGYVSAFITGFFFVSTFTVAPAAVLLFHLAESLNPVLLALLAGVGTVLGDFVLFRFLKDRVYEEFAPYVHKIGESHLTLLLKTPYFGWFAPVLGALIIASPFPDELGISLLGLSKISTVQFMALTYVLNVAGIFLIILLAQV